MERVGFFARLRAIFGRRSTRDGTSGHDVDKLREKLDAAYREQSSLLAQVRRGVADVSTARRRVEVQLAQLQAQLDDLDAKASQAVAEGNDELARTLLGQRVSRDRAAAGLREQQASLAGEETKLLTTVDSLERQIEDFRMKRDTLSARYSAASARAEINSATTGIGSAASEVGQAMAEAERRTKELDATANAVDELIAEGIIEAPGSTTGSTDSWDAQFEAAMDKAGPQNAIPDTSVSELSASESAVSERAEGDGQNQIPQ